MKFPKLSTTWRHVMRARKKKCFLLTQSRRLRACGKPYSCWVDDDRDNSRQQCASPAVATQAHAFLQDALYK